MHTFKTHTNHLDASTITNRSREYKGQGRGKIEKKNQHVTCYCQINQNATVYKTVEIMLGSMTKCYKGE